MKSSDFIRLEKTINTNYGSFVDVYEFHTVVNGNLYIARHEETTAGGMMANYPVRDCTKETGNARYIQLKENGYKYTGRYQMDILGYKTKKGE